MKNVINAGDTCILSNSHGYFEIKVLSIDLLTDKVELQILVSTNSNYPVNRIYHEQVKSLMYCYEKKEAIVQSMP